jgi:hypothetical protein
MDPFIENHDARSAYTRSVAKPQTITTHMKPAPGSKIDKRVRRALRQYRVKLRADERAMLSAAVHGYDLMDPEARRIARNRRRARAGGV